MQKIEAQLIWEIFSSVAPYLAHPQEMRDALEKLLEEELDIKAFQEHLLQTFSSEEDQTRKTDIQIFINELYKKF